MECAKRCDRLYPHEILRFLRARLCRLHARVAVPPQKKPRLRITRNASRRLRAQLDLAWPPKMVHIGPSWTVKNHVSGPFWVDLGPVALVQSRCRKWNGAWASF